MTESATTVAQLAADRERYAGRMNGQVSEQGVSDEAARSGFESKTRSHGGEAVWAYRYRIAGRDSRRLQRGGFKSERAAREALERALARLRREQGLVEAPRLRELVDLYLAQHGGEPETVAKLRWLLTKAVRAFGHRRINQLRPAEIATWRMNISGGHRFEATQALRQVLGRAVSWTDRRQSGEAGHRQPPTPLHRETALRVMGRTRSARRRTRTAIRAARALRRRDRAASRRVDRA